MSAAVKKTIVEGDLRIGDRIIHVKGAEFAVIAKDELPLPDKKVLIFRLLPTDASGDIGLMEGPLLSVDTRGLSGFTLKETK